MKQKTKSRTQSKPVIKGLLYLGLLTLALFFISRGLSPLNRLEEYKTYTDSDSLFVQNYSPIYDYPEIQPLLREKTFKESQLKLSEDDSIQMVLNLHDSTLCLVIRGVKLHTVQLTMVKIDPLIRNLPNREYTKLMQQPLFVQSQFSTIVKEPVVVRDAPKNPEEAALIAYKPDTLIQKPAYLVLELEHGIILKIEQDKIVSMPDKWSKIHFESHVAVNLLLEDLRGFISFRKQFYKPTISIKLPANELRTIYRAIPVKPMVVVTYY